MRDSVPGKLNERIVCGEAPAQAERIIICEFDGLGRTESPEVEASRRREHTGRTTRERQACPVYDLGIPWPAVWAPRGTRVERNAVEGNGRSAVT